MKERAPTSLFPDVVGSTWVYQSTDKQEWTEIVTQAEDRKDGKVVFVGRVSGWKVVPVRRLFITKQALYELPKLDEKNPAIPLVKFDGKAGDKWSWESRHPVGPGMDFELGETAEVQVPPGRFQCVSVTTRIRYFDKEFVDKTSPTDWYAPGIGLIKSESRIETVTLKAFYPREK